MKPQDPRTVLRALSLYFYNVNLADMLKAINRPYNAAAPLQQGWHKLTGTFPTFIHNLGEQRDAFIADVINEYEREAGEDIATQELFDSIRATDGFNAAVKAIIERKRKHPMSPVPEVSSSAVDRLMATDLKPLTEEDRECP